MALAQRTGRSRHRLVLLALIAITLLTVDLNGFGPVESAQRVTRDAMQPVTSLATIVFSPVGDAWNSIFNYGDLETENAELRAELEELRGAAIRGEADTETLRRLLAVTALPYVGDVATVTATVVRGSVGNFEEHVITIDKGSRQGIDVGMAVVTAAGMVGRVDQVDNSTARVQLLSDASLFIGARLVSTDAVGLGHAVPGEPRTFLIDRGINWPDSVDPALLPEVGSAVVTSAESRYPADIPLGRVAAVELADDEVSMEVTVELANNVDDLQFVTVLLAEKPDSFPLDPVVPVPTVGLGSDLLDPTAPGGDE